MIFKNFSEEFNGKLILITGGNGQIGSEIVESYLQASAKVICLDPEPPQKQHDPNRFEWIKTDITDKKEVESFFAKLIEKNSIPDILINCAGISVFSPFEERTEEQFNGVVQVNLNGTFLLSQAIFRIWKERNIKGIILNFGSIYGVSIADMRIYGDSGRNSPEVYAITKAGIIHFTKYLARYAAPYGIRVNCISPGGIFDNQHPDFIKNYVYKTPLGRMGEPTDLIGAIFFLTSSMSGYITGQNLLVDGGFTIGD
ncbi:SDR family oxidoreductase [Leptospira idonii]|uniref:SDR family oxidoreductase n=1 Tax=Leptospira idonii TaxID=1193500 RepID=A0A4R9LZB7_9LEPT|nr:SDR family oxidoreductase [Leptospira idonii]TGN18259.1 SDR family oxidoreductase [Leptospira idonii]